MSNRTYDLLKWLALLGLPALATLIATLGELWGLPHRLELVGTVTALDAFLGTALGLTSKAYHTETTARHRAGTQSTED